MSERTIGLDGTEDDNFQDPDLLPPGAEDRAETTQLQDVLGKLESALTADVDFEPVTLELVKRPGVSVRYSTQITDDQMKVWQKRAADKNAVEGIDPMKFMSLVLANQCEAILWAGQVAVDESGQPLTFAHARIRKLYGAQRVVECVRKAYGSDPHLLVDGNQILEKAGFADQAVEVDDFQEGPTSAS